MTIFQGKPVQSTKVTLTGGAKEVFEVPPAIDQIVEVRIEGRVTGVDYRVNDKTGDLEEVVRVKVLELDELRTMSFPKAVSTPSGTTPMVDTETGEIQQAAG